jgi:hypothetical protein
VQIARHGAQAHARGGRRARQIVWVERKTGSVDGPTGKVADILSCWAGMREHFGPIEIYRKAGNELVRVGSKERWGGDKLDHKKIYI